MSEVDKYVQPGQTIKARIYNVDIAANKVGLTMRSPEAQQQRAERQAERSGERQDRSQAPVQARARRAPKGGTISRDPISCRLLLRTTSVAVHSSDRRHRVPAGP